MHWYKEGFPSLIGSLFCKGDRSQQYQATGLRSNVKYRILPNKGAECDSKVGPDIMQ